MIGLVARLFGLSNLLSMVLVYGGIALAAWGAWQWRYHSGVVAGRAEVRAQWDAAVQKERDRVAEAVAAAQAEAQKTIDALEKREEELNAELIALAGEAANDANAKSCGITRDGVRRHKRLWKN